MARDVRSAFDADGYVVVEGVVSARATTHLRERAERALEAEPRLDLLTPPAEDDDIHALMARRAARYDELFPDRRRGLLGRGPAVVLETLLDDEPVMIPGGMPFRHGSSRAASHPHAPGPRRNTHIHSSSTFARLPGCVLAWLVLDCGPAIAASLVVDHELSVALDPTRDVARSFWTQPLQP